MSSAYPNQRNRDPQPLGHAGETALVVLCAAVLALSLAALAGLDAACWIAGGGWVWPHGTTTATHTLAGLLSGHPGRGLPPGLARRIPAAAVVYTGVAVSELLLMLLAGLAWWGVSRWVRPGDARRGMATRAEAAAVLGAGRLRSVRAILRPDVYGPAVVDSPATDAVTSGTGEDAQHAPAALPEVTR